MHFYVSKPLSPSAAGIAMFAAVLISIKSRTMLNEGFHHSYSYEQKSWELFTSTRTLILFYECLSRLSNFSIVSADMSLYPTFAFSIRALINKTAWIHFSSKWLLCSTVLLDLETICLVKTFDRINHRTTCCPLWQRAGFSSSWNRADMEV